MAGPAFLKSNFPLKEKGKACFPLKYAFCLLTLELHPGGVLEVLQWSPAPGLLRTGLPLQAAWVDSAVQIRGRWVGRIPE